MERPSVAVWRTGGVADWRCGGVSDDSRNEQIKDSWPGCL